MRWIPCLLLAALVASTALGDEAADRRTCANGRADAVTRIAACTRLIDDEALPATDRAWALVHRGYVQLWEDKPGEALADFDRAVAFDPQSARAFRGRARARHVAKRPSDEVVADWTRGIELEPKYAGGYVGRGRIYLLEEATLPQALADFEQALRLDPRSEQAYVSRSEAHYRLKHYEQALADANAAMLFDRWDPYAFQTRALIHRAMGRPELALRDYRTAFLFDPNLYRIEEARIPSVVEGMTPAAVPDVAPYAAPPTGLALRFAQVMTEKGRDKEDMELAVDDLIRWFKRPTLPRPIMKEFVRREVTGVAEDGTVRVAALKNPDAELEKDRLRQDVGYYRALWATVLPGPSGHPLAVEYDRAAIDALWPLAVGKTAHGEGTIWFVCPDPLDPPSRFLGCGEPGQKLKMGAVTWSAKVTGLETVTVGAGLFRAFVVQVTESVGMELMGRPAPKRESALTYWYAPAAGWWVRRERVFESEGRKAIVDEAMAVDLPGR